MQGVRDFCFCPLCYRFRYLDGVEAPNRLDDKFDKDLHTVIYGYFNYMLDDRKPPTLKRMLEHWFSVWDKRETKEEILNSITPKNTASQEYRAKTLYKRGMKAIRVFHDLYLDRIVVPILVGKNYNVELGKYTVHGTLDLVQETHDLDNRRELEIVDFKTGRKEIHIHQDINLTAASLAFRYLFGVKENRLVYHNLIRDSVSYTRRDDKDYQALQRILDMISYCTTNNAFYPVMNESCMRCTYYGHCNRKGWL